MKTAKWERKPLGAVAELCLGKMLDQNKNRGEPLPYLANVNVRWGQFDLTDLRQMRFEPKEIDRYGLKFGDIVMCEGGEPGRCAIWREQIPGMMIQKALHRIRPKELLDYRFLYYSFLYLGRSKAFDQYFTGATIKHLPGEKLAKVEVDIPPLATQNRIASILSTYDESIENSLRRIKILESMARALYREWFVHFHFPGHESVPRVPSALGQIPQGWGVTPLDSLKSDQPYAINGGPFGSKLVSKDYRPAGIPVIRGSNLSESGRFDPTGFVFVAAEKAQELRANLAKPGDIVVTQRGTLGQIALIPSGIGYDQFVISQSQMKLTLHPAKVNREYVFFSLRSEEARKRIKNLASSSGVPHINLAVLREFQVLVPPIGLQAKFGEFALGTELAIEAMQRRIDNLRRTRDLLLPRLMSGQIDVEAISA